MTLIRGSSPRMRGTLDCRAAGRFRVRFIPAYAGNTNAELIATGRQPVHPRVCGEHIYLNAGNAAQAGSSPRMRGTHLGGDVQHPGHRFIPAYAGNTCLPTTTTIFRAVHPRVCGEHVA